MNNSDYQQQIHQLVELQKVDDKIFDVKEKLGNAPKNLTELEHKFNAIDARRNHILDKLAHLKEQKKRLSLEIDDDSAKIKKSKNKLMQVGNTREYQAMLVEMDSMEKINRTREEEKVALLDELQIQTSNLEEIDVEYNAVREELEQKRSTLDDTIRQANEELEELNKKRDEASSFIDPSIFMRYEFIRKRLEHPVIVEVENGICSGCHIAIPPQEFIKLQLGNEIQSCPNCQRLIFWSQHFENPQEPERQTNTESGE